MRMPLLFVGLALLLSACSSSSGPPVNASNPVACAFNGPCTGRAGPPAH